MRSDLKDKVCIITGANTGIGKETAHEIASMGAHLFLACRSEDKALPVVEELKRETENSKIEFIKLDLSSLESVRHCAAIFKQRNLPLHLLVNNAGVAGARGVTAEGFELTFGVNHLGHFLFTQELARRLEGSGITTYSLHPGVVASDVWRNIPFPLNLFFSACGEALHDFE